MATGEITCSDLLHLPHVLVCKRADGGIQVIEYDKEAMNPGGRAHADLFAFMATHEYKEILVCVRLRRLEALLPP